MAASAGRMASNVCCVARHLSRASIGAKWREIHVGDSNSYPLGDRSRLIMLYKCFLWCGVIEGLLKVDYASSERSGRMLPRWT